MDFNCSTSELGAIYLLAKVRQSGREWIPCLIAKVLWRGLRDREWCKVWIETDRNYALPPKKPGFYRICGLQQNIVVKNPVSSPQRTNLNSSLQSSFRASHGRRTPVMNHRNPFPHSPSLPLSPSVFWGGLALWDRGLNPWRTVEWTLSWHQWAVMCPYSRQLRIDKYLNRVDTLRADEIRTDSCQSS